MFELLPDKIEIPDGELELVIEFGLSNRQQDIDNGLKPFVDIMQKMYDFNDNRIYSLIVHKVIVPKGEEFIRFQFYPYEEYDEDDLWTCT